MTEHAFALAEHDRRLANLLRLGSVTEVDAAAGRARVQLDPDWISDFLPWFELRAGARLRTFSAPSVGETVMVLSTTGETAAGVILRGLFSDVVPAPADDPDITILGAWDDGTVEQHDAAQKLRTITIPGDGGLIINAGGCSLVLRDGVAIIQATEIVTDGATRLNRGVRPVSYAGSANSRGDVHVQGASGVYV